MNTIKHHKTILLAIIALLSLFAYPIMAEEETTSPSCAELGYNTPVDDCISAGGVPLLCPFSNADIKTCICQIRSCRGYPLFKDGEDYYYTTLDGSRVKATPTTGTIEDYIDGELESCTIGYGREALTYYRVPKCLDGFMYQNHICDKGCDLEQYPFTTHPGNLAGEVQVCKDENGDHYGYTKCNAGWVQNGASCTLNSCDIKEYLYMDDPNEDEYRGEVEICKIGGNAYYKYTSCDAGFEKKKGVCVGKCEITDCTSTQQTVTSNGTSRTYNEWTCKLNNPKCRVGDTATYQGIDVGTIFHLPDGEDNRVHMMSIGNSSTATKSLKWAKGIAQTIDVIGLTNFPTKEKAITDKDGKMNSKLILSFRDSKGWTQGGTDSYPAVEFCATYTVGCTSGTMCAIGEWYLPSEGELGYMYDNRYLLYNATGSTQFYASYFWSSTETGSTNAWYVYFIDGGRVSNYKTNTRYASPTLSFTASNSSDFTGSGNGSGSGGGDSGSGDDSGSSGGSGSGGDSGDSGGSSTPSEPTCSLTSTTLPTNCTTATDSCTKNGTTYYSTTCQTCSTGYESDGSGGCRELCEYTLTAPNTGCKTVDSCTRNGSTYYSGTCQACYDGYTLDGALCQQTCLLTSSMLPLNCEVATDSCVLGSASGNTTYYSASCQTCASGYEKINDTCVKTCTTPGACQVGDIYAYNGSAIGVVFANEDGVSSKLVALTDIDPTGASGSSKMYWSSATTDNYSYSSGATNTTDTTIAFNDMNGKYNSEKILSYTSYNGYPAAATTATSLYTPSICETYSSCAKGNWYLPAAGELLSLYNNKTVLNSSFSSAGGNPFTEDQYWSSTERSSSNAWYVSFSDGSKSFRGRGAVIYVRPALQLCAEGYANANGTCTKACTTPGACQVGDIYTHNDTPIGIVFANEDGVSSKLVALTDIDTTGASGSSTMYWSTSSSGTHSYTTGATITTDETTALNDMNGKYNTEKILSYIASNGYTAEATTASSLYAPSACGTGSMCAKGNWYLPAAGELWTLYNNKATLSGAAFTEDDYWSSTEYNAVNAWYVSFTAGGRNALIKRATRYVRPVLALCAEGYINANGTCIKACTTPGACQVGDIYAYNGSAIGVVFANEDGVSSKLVALTDIDKTGASSSSAMYWSTSSSGTYSYTTGATITTYETTAFNDMNGKNNTSKILSYISANSKTAEAATASSLYAPSACGTGSICAAGNWYLPAAGELWTLYNNKETLNSKFTSNSGAAFTENWYWSSTEYSANYAWGVRFSTGYRGEDSKYGSHYVRPVLALCAEGYENIDGNCIIPCTTPGACEIGDIYAYNGSAIGVVFFDDGSTTKIVALTDIKKDGTSGSATMYWASKTDYNWSTGATQSSDATTALNDMNGKYNTSKILSYISANSKTAEAATATSLYAPSVCETGSICAKGNWYLPAAGELWTLYSNKTTLNSKFTSNSGAAFEEDYYWSSTEGSSAYAWNVYFISGTRGATNKYSSYLYVRPVLALCAEGKYLSTDGTCAVYTNTTAPENCAFAGSYTANGTTYYSNTCQICASGYEADGSGVCQVSCALTSTSLPSNCTTATDSCVKNGTTYYSTTCQTCNNGWTASNGSCVANTCSGYGSSTTGCSNYTTCLSGSTTKYKCTSCNSGYQTNSSGGCSYIDTCECYKGLRTSGAYTSAECSSLGYGSGAVTCKKGTTTYYGCYSGACIEEDR